jgi:hypothetical protein
VCAWPAARLTPWQRVLNFDVQGHGACRGWVAHQCIEGRNGRQGLPRLFAPSATNLDHAPLEAPAKVGDYWQL